jgi:glycerol dehydrogenase
VVAPTIASNDSPTSRLIVLYDEQHRLVGVDMLARNPDLVLVDTAVIVRAPIRFFRAGIGDAISKRYEAAQCLRSKGRNFFEGRPTQAAGLMADHCHTVIVAHGAEALSAVARHTCNEAVERVIEATVLMSGLGFESGGLSLSHALLRGLTAMPDLARALHGEMVAFGTLVQLILEYRPAVEVRTHAALLVALGLPVSFAELGRISFSAEELRRIAELALQASYAAHFQRPLVAAEVVDAIRQADALGRAVKSSP